MGDAVVEVEYQKGDVIYEQGSPGCTMYMLFAGSISVTKNGEVVASLEGTAGDTHIFGQGALLDEKERQATVTVTSEKGAKALALDRDHFDMLLGPLKDILSSRAGN